MLHKKKLEDFDLEFSRTPEYKPSQKKLDGLSVVEVQSLLPPLNFLSRDPNARKFIEHLIGRKNLQDIDYQNVLVYLDINSDSPCGSDKYNTDLIIDPLTGKFTCKKRANIYQGNDDENSGLSCPPKDGNPFAVNKMDVIVPTGDGTTKTTHKSDCFQPVVSGEPVCPPEPFLRDATGKIITDKDGKAKADPRTKHIVDKSGRGFCVDETGGEMGKVLLLDSPISGVSSVDASVLASTSDKAATLAKLNATQDDYRKLMLLIERHGDHSPEVIAQINPMSIHYKIFKTLFGKKKETFSSDKAKGILTNAMATQETKPNVEQVAIAAIAEV